MEKTKGSWINFMCDSPFHKPEYDMERSVSGESVKACNRIAKRIGWEKIGGLWYCPDCIKAYAKNKGLAKKITKKVPFKMIFHMAEERGHQLDYYNKELNITVMRWTPIKYRKFRDPEIEYRTVIDGETKSYASLFELLLDNPDILEKAMKLYGNNGQ